MADAQGILAGYFLTEAIFLIFVMIFIEGLREAYFNTLKRMITEVPKDICAETFSVKLHPVNLRESSFSISFLKLEKFAIFSFHEGDSRRFFVPRSTHFYAKSKGDFVWVLDGFLWSFVLLDHPSTRFFHGTEHQTKRLWFSPFQMHCLHCSSCLAPVFNKHFSIFTHGVGVGSSRISLQPHSQFKH